MERLLLSDVIRMLKPDEIRAYRLMERLADADSGASRGHFHPYSKDAPFNLEQEIEKEKVRWSTPLSEPGWRRVFCWFVEGEMVGHLTLVGGNLPSELHRVSFGMGLLPKYRGKGGGTKLLKTCLEWAHADRRIAWVDLGVFGDNSIAESFYRKMGFIEIGRQADRFRIDGAKLDNISMTYYVGDKAVRS